MPHGGRRSGSGRPQKDSIRVTITLERATYQELLRLESQSGIYRSRIIARLVCQGLFGAVCVKKTHLMRAVNHEAHEAKPVRLASRSEHPELLDRMPRRLCDFHW